MKYSCLTLKVFLSANLKAATKQVTCLQWLASFKRWGPFDVDLFDFTLLQFFWILDGTFGVVQTATNFFDWPIRGTITKE